MSKQIKTPNPAAPDSVVEAAQLETAQHVGNVRLLEPEPVRISEKWKQHIGHAKIVWAKISEGDLLKSDGQAERLTMLVEHHYSIDHDAAKQRVKNFLQHYKLSLA